MTASQVIIGVSGSMGAGKDTVANYLVEHYGFTRVAFADPVREALLTIDPYLADGQRLSHHVATLGYDRLKRESTEVRRLLQTFSTEVVRDMIDPNAWVRIGLEHVAFLSPKPVVISDVRFVNEASALREAGAKIWRVRRAAVDSLTYLHKSESGLPDPLVDVEITNNSDLNALYAVIDEWVHLPSGFSYRLVNGRMEPSEMAD